jgi:Sec-independent protein translocase protein TatA
MSEASDPVNLFGIGNLELIAISVIALVVLGPNRIVDVARTLGKFWKEAQLTIRSLADAATVKLDEPAVIKPMTPTPVPEPEGAVARESQGTGEESDEDAAANADSHEDTRG